MTALPAKVILGSARAFPHSSPPVTARPLDLSVKDWRITFSLLAPRQNASLACVYDTISPDRFRLRRVLVQPRRVLRTHAPARRRAYVLRSASEAVRSGRCRRCGIIRQRASTVTTWT